MLVGRIGTEWNVDPPNIGRCRAQDIIRTPPGITNAGRCNTIEESFSFFMTPEMLDLVVLETNHEANRNIREWNENHPQNQRTWVATDRMEMKAFIGLSLYAGLYKSNHEPVASLWSEKEERPVFTATMARQRFTDILKFLCFDNHATRAERQATDKLAPFRDLWTMFQAQLPKYYVPGIDLCVDEQFVAFRGRCSFHQYIPSKPAKYGMKIWWCCDTETSYPLKCEIYL